MNKDINILAIESSCDETSAAVITNGKKIKSHVIATQVNSHARFGGVVPEVASRHHIETIGPVLRATIKEADMDMEQIDAIAVTKGPGLVGSLLVGVGAAKALSEAYNKPLIGVNHLAGHLMATKFKNELKYPALGIIVSGGHTELVYIAKENDYKIIGQTVDDAVGEAYDKVGRVLGLKYPAGKKVDELAALGKDSYNLPRAMINDGSLNFSFSGLKSAFINLYHNAEQRGEELDDKDLARSFQQSVTDTLEAKISDALSKVSINQIILAGGVAANSQISKMVKQLGQKVNVPVAIPELRLCGDNAAMIGAQAFLQYLQNDFTDFSLNAMPNLDFEELTETKIIE